ncbi:hypothetical protein ACOSP7_013470 [Xanthoceras sorbifolium]
MELVARTELKKELVEKANRCHALRKEMKLEMNMSVAKFNDQMCVLKDKIERAKADLQHSYDLLERQTGNLARKNEQLASKDKSLKEQNEEIQDEVHCELLYNLWLWCPDLDLSFFGPSIEE